MDDYCLYAFIDFYSGSRSYRYSHEVVVVNQTDGR